MLKGVSQSAPDHEALPNPPAPTVAVTPRDFRSAVLTAGPDAGVPTCRPTPLVTLATPSSRHETIPIAALPSGQLLLTFSCTPASELPAGRSPRLNT